LLFSDLLLSLAPVAFVIAVLFTFSLPYLLGAIPNEILSSFLFHLILLRSVALHDPPRTFAER
jgi:hypothetical protein